MKRYFSIGDMAKIHNVTVQTLRHYDNIGLFKPSRVEQLSGYRYYSIDQFSHLDLIKYLKYIGMPLREIKDIVGGKEAEMADILDEKLTEIDLKIRQLKLAKKVIENRRGRIDTARKHGEAGSIYTKQIEKRSIISVRYKSKYDDDDREFSRRKIGGILEENIGVFYGGVGGLVSLQKLKDMEKVLYECCFVCVEADDFDGSAKKQIMNIPQGEYLCMLYKGHYSKNYIHFKNIVEYAQKSNLKLKDQIYEIPIVDPLATSDENELLTEIQIPLINR